MKRSEAGQGTDKGQSCEIKQGIIDDDVGKPYNLILITSPSDSTCSAGTSSLSSPSGSAAIGWHYLYEAIRRSSPMAGPSRSNSQ